MRIRNVLPVIYFILGFVFAGIAFYLSLQWETGIAWSRREAFGGGVDIAADGGALGFALLSGICFLCSTYLIKGKIPT